MPPTSGTPLSAPKPPPPSARGSSHLTPRVSSSSTASASKHGTPYLRRSAHDGSEGEPARGAGFAVYIRRHCQRIHRENPEATVAEVRRLLCNEWLQLTPAERRAWRASPANQAKPAGSSAAGGGRRGTAGRASDPALKGSPAAKKKLELAGRSPLTPMTPAAANGRRAAPATPLAMTPEQQQNGRGEKAGLLGDSPAMTPVSAPGASCPADARVAQIKAGMQAVRPGHGGIATRRESTLILVDWDDTLMCTFDLIERCAATFPSP